MELVNRRKDLTMNTEKLFIGTSMRDFDPTPVDSMSESDGEPGMNDSKNSNADLKVPH